MTCLAGNPALPGFASVSEVLLRKSPGGAAAVWAPSGLSDHDKAAVLAEGFYTAVYASGGGRRCLVCESEGPRSLRIGDAILASSRAYQSWGGPGHMVSIYTLWGDPAMRIR